MVPARTKLEASVRAAKEEFMELEIGNDGGFIESFLDKL